MDLSEILQLNRAELDKLSWDSVKAAILEEQRIDASLPIERDEHQNPIYHLQRTLKGDGSLAGQKEISGRITTPRRARSRMLTFGNITRMPVRSPVSS